MTVVADAAASEAIVVVDAEIVVDAVDSAVTAIAMIVADAEAEDVAVTAETATVSVVDAGVVKHKLHQALALG